MRINDLVTRWARNFRPVGNLLEEPIILGCAIRAAETYASHAPLKSQNFQASDQFLNESTDITPSEWGLIEPLFLLYVEKEESVYIDAMKQFGGDIERRTNSEISQDIERYLDGLPRKSFMQGPISLQIPEPYGIDRHGFLCPMQIQVIPRP